MSALQKALQENRNKVSVANASGKRVNTYITEEQNKRGREAYSSNGKQTRGNKRPKINCTRDQT